ncbi:hypothetical protein CQA66_08215 [Helicobacter aurati]|uniref:Uncharacterized protein n=1 Tax=Helicobacter aurati TaxID=137778 RepID=A0A3D8IYN6_9HELI|nr:hypothetical protein [Helicobacter aurati]RDU70382.1 hypothetical protein CQA66_08215 [Helicobacter aurati]
MYDLQIIELLLSEKKKEYGDFKDIANYVMEFYKINIAINPHIQKFTKDKRNATKLTFIMLGLKLARLNIQSDNQDTLKDFFAYVRLFNKSVNKKITLINTKNSTHQQIELINQANNTIRDYST